MRTLCSAIGIATLCLAGCATQAPLEPNPVLPDIFAGQSGLIIIRIESEPMGAMVVQNGHQLGRAPLAVRVPVSAYGEEGQTKLSCTSSEQVTLTWESGASTTVTGLCRHYPAVTAIRPEEAPDLEVDLRAAAREQQARNEGATAARIINSHGGAYPSSIALPRSGPFPPASGRPPVPSNVPRQ
jgi:hypothetical protein